MNELKYTIMVCWILGLAIKMRAFANMLLWDGPDILVFLYMLSLVFLTFVLAISLDKITDQIHRILALADIGVARLLRKKY